MVPATCFDVDQDVAGFDVDQDVAGFDVDQDVAGGGAYHVYR
jgi:hypothetical protein